ncbi:MAG TPA: hypothetical protein VGE46_07195 [Bdellovibrio sp.]
MKKINLKTSLSGLGLVLLILVAFQNCSPNAFKMAGDDELSSLAPAGNSSGEDPVRSGPGTTGGEVGYSETCDDYASAGWASKEDCLKDGEWHLVIEVPAGGGAPTIGSIEEINRHVQAGTDVKVIIPEQRLYAYGSPTNIIVAGNEECQQVYRGQQGTGPIYCLTTMRLTGENSGEISHGSARYGTDGSMYCLGSSGSNGNGCTVDPVRYKWYIRY